ncbi:regulatory protein [Actinoalloteichus hoggarensis]|uniref:Regulatory protein RecX n=1 Tax=Actinoalloteichus hoggarensis TaxID=1470176 RepID=A0A221W0F6_9PSEU|nr:regulatory protein RecX [Actinoalloteichus hoggarensis]ASO19247.1 Regulatory protein RecX [Actinoalloteichus hoggarensis]MBB5920485.1 regulatory protein [Actinoalloteichus hoggarensis]
MARFRSSTSNGDDAEQREAAAAADPATRARDYCLRLLTSRPRTRAELAQALVRREVDQGIIDQVLGRLDEVGLIDDQSFAEMWVRSRHTHQGLGRRALLQELRRKGVDADVAAEAAQGLDREAEEERARQLVRRKLAASAGADERVRMRRLVGMLARKGYSQGLAFEVVRAELAAEGTDDELLDELRD